MTHKRSSPLRRVGIGAAGTAFAALCVFDVRCFRGECEVDSQAVELFHDAEVDQLGMLCEGGGFDWGIPVTDLDVQALNGELAKVHARREFFKTNNWVDSL